VELVDIGVNLTSGQFARDRDQVVARAVEAGVKTLILTGTSVPASHEAAALAAAPSPAALFATAGVHPHHAQEATGSWLAELEALLAQPRVVAVGECGLDFDRNFSPRAEQLRCFEAQLELAAALGRPVFLHERAAHAEVLALVAKYRDRLPAAVIHCFTGSEEELAAYLALDLHVGLTGWICDERRGLAMQAYLGRIPAPRLMVETDAPYLLPRTMPRRAGDKNRRNEPAFLPWVVATLAAARGETAEMLATTTTATARRFFRLPTA